MEKTKLGDTKFGVKPNLKEVDFYEAPKEGCPKFIMKDDKCRPKDLPKWGVK